MNWFKNKCKDSACDTEPTQYVESPESKQATYIFNRISDLFTEWDANMPLNAIFCWNVKSIILIHNCLSNNNGNLKTLMQVEYERYKPTFKAQVWMNRMEQQYLDTLTTPLERMVMYSLSLKLQRQVVTDYIVRNNFENTITDEELNKLFPPPDLTFLDNLSPKLTSHLLQMAQKMYGLANCTREY